MAPDSAESTHCAAHRTVVHAIGKLAGIDDHDGFPARIVIVTDADWCVYVLCLPF